MGTQGGGEGRGVGDTEEVRGEEWGDTGRR